MGDAEQAHAARSEQPLPVEAGGAAPAVVADVEVGELVLEVASFGEAEPDVVVAGDVHHPDAIARRQVVDRLGVERVEHRHAAEADVVGEEVEEAPPRRDDPRALAAC